MLCSCGSETLKNETRCRPCQALYMRTWRQKRLEKIARRAYFKGTEDARVMAIRAFQKIGDGQMNGSAAAEIMKRLCFT